MAAKQASSAPVSPRGQCETQLLQLACSGASGDLDKDVLLYAVSRPGKLPYDGRSGGDLHPRFPARTRPLFSGYHGWRG